MAIFAILFLIGLIIIPIALVIAIWANDWLFYLKLAGSSFIIAMICGFVFKIQYDDYIS